MNHLDLFAGIGGFSVAAKWLGIETTQMVENNPFCQQVLSKNFPGIPIWSDICDYHPHPGQFDLYTIGFPCQGNSRANHKGQGLEDERSGLWFEALRAVHEGQPRFVVVENTPPTANRNWIRTVLEGLGQAGFDAEWEIVSAAEVGAPHLRERLFVVAYSHGWRLAPKSQGQELRGRIEPCGNDQVVSFAHACSNGLRGRTEPTSKFSETQSSGPQPGSLGMDDGLPAWLHRITFSGWWQDNPAPINAGVATRSIPHRGDRIQACGNSVSPQVAEIALRRVLQLVTDHRDVPANKKATR